MNTKNNSKILTGITLQWMLAQARACGLPLNDRKAQHPRYSNVDRFAPISENKEVKIDPRRKIQPGDEIDPSARSLDLAVGESHSCEVLAESKYNWSGVKLRGGATYIFSVPEGDTWDIGVTILVQFRPTTTYSFYKTPNLSFFRSWIDA